MTTMDVQIRSLPPMSVVASLACGPAPEVNAWAQLSAWADSVGFLDDPVTHPVFGFNNPPPEPGRADYGYEFWLKADAHIPVPGNLQHKEFKGGRYAVTLCRLEGDPRGSVTNVWQMLVERVRKSPYRLRQTHELEHHLNPGASASEIVLALYLPVEEDLWITSDPVLLPDPVT